MNRFIILRILAILAVVGHTCYGDRILFLLPLASKSHVNVFEPLMRALSERGHEIVALTPVLSSNMPPTVKHIQLITVEDLSGGMPDAFEERKKSGLGWLSNSSTFEIFDNACVKSLKHPKLHELLKTDKFDLVFVDILINYCMLGVIPMFEASSIFVSTVPAPPYLSTVVGNRLPPTFVPSNVLQYSDRMSFTQRMINTFTENFIAVLWNKMFIEKGEILYRKHLPNGQNLPGIEEIQRNVSMIFVNSHFSVGYPRPLLPDVIEVGGMHTRPAKKLPKDLDDFLSGSGEHGFILFSLGSVVKPKQLPESTRKVFVKVFSKLKQRVLWKWDDETMPDLPNNVKLTKWVPQQDVLGHPKIRLFMSHGGLLSTQESIYHGVPVLGVPVFGDQDLNIRFAESRGYARHIEIIDLTEENLENTLLEMLNNPSYQETVKEFSKLSRDLPETPLQKALYWAEYVLRHKGAPHLISAARDLSFIQYYAIDIAVVVFLIGFVILIIALQCCKGLCRCLFGKSKSKTKRE